MGTGAFRIPTAPTGPRRCLQAGFTFLESVVTLAVAGTLALGVCAIDLDRQGLTAARSELRTTLDQAFMLAHHRGTSVRVMAKADGSPDVLPLQLPKKVKWGLLPGVPLPKGMEDPKVADQGGEAHRAITVSPRHTATATTWFLNDGRDVVCMRLSGQGRMTLLRWKQDEGKWVRR
jgi:prepilin-type N-terminal cleavage/methylation domain-containing protein